MTGPSVRRLLETRKVLICAGAGGVGKTSVTAALSVAAARRGRRVLALTVDPALRLADSLGVSAKSDARQPVSSARCAELGIDPGHLSVMMLDPRATWTELIARTEPDPAERERILQHPLFRMLLGYLAGANEYMAMEKLLQVLDSGGQDLVVLDTPPSRHALDFLEAPDRLVDAIDGPLIHALASGVREGGKFSLGLMSRWLVPVVRTLGRLMGVRLLEQMGELLFELNRALGGLGARAERVRASFRDPGFGYVLVSRPSPGAVADTLFFEQALARMGLAGDVVIVNGTHAARYGTAPAHAVDRAPFREELSRVLEPPLLAKVERAVRDHDAIVATELSALSALRQGSRAFQRHSVVLPSFPGGAVGVSELGDMARRLTADEAASDPGSGHPQRL